VTRCSQKLAWSDLDSGNKALEKLKKSGVIDVSVIKPTELVTSDNNELNFPLKNANNDK
jgi:hypothetical protein